MSPRIKPAGCAGCACQSHGTDFSSIEGTGASGVMLVGEASGEHEQRDQLPFRPYAPAGGVLERTLRCMGLDRQAFSITNILRCRPRNNWLEKSPWEYGAIAHCRENIEQAILERKPRMIVALGGIALRELTGLAGEKQGISYLAGYPLPLSAGLARMPIAEAIPVLGNFHPSFLRHGKMAYGGIFARILQRGMNIARGGDREWLWGVEPEDRRTYDALDYRTHPTLDDAWSYYHWLRDNPSLVVSYDLETMESASLDEDAREGFRDTEIRLAQFCAEPGRAVAFPWEGAYREVVQSILHLPHVKCGHNVWLFDNRVLRAAGEREGLDLTPRGTIHDTLQMLHHWQPDLPAHLQFAAQYISFPFPWKHLAATDLEFYGCCDVDATLRLYRMLERTLQRDGLWGDHDTGYVGQVQEVRPVLAAMEDRGMPIDDGARLALDGEFEKAQVGLLGELQAAAPVSCGRVHPKEGYKGVPPEIKPWLTSEGAELGDFVFIKDKRFKESGDDGEFYHYESRVFTVPTVDPATDEPTLTEINRWCRVYDFNPNSRPQVLAYMKAKSHPVPKDKHREDAEGNNPDTTNEKELRRLANRTGDTFYIKVIEYRGLTKMRGTYIEGFRPGVDGCVHTTFTFDTGIGQLSSRNPNCQNFPKLKPTVELAKAMRKMVAPGDPDYILTEWDFKSCHVITLGFLAEDLNYMRLGRLDIHSFVAGHFLRLWNGLEIFKESDQELLARFKWLKSDPARKRVRDDQAKHGILGIGNGLKAKGLYDRYMESFPPQRCACVGGMEKGARGMRKCSICKGARFIPGSRIAEQVLEICEELFPKVFEYQRREVQTAHKQQFLKTPFAHVRRFYEVFRWDHRKGDWGHGDQHEEAVAYRLANIAFGHIREKLKMLDAGGMAGKYGLFNNVHDSFMFSFHSSLLEEHVREVAPVLLAPSKVLRHPVICPGGLVIGVEASWGPNWKDMRELPLPLSKENPVDSPRPSVVG